MTAIMDLLVIGSLNSDLALAVKRFPSPGETIAATGTLSGPGGKGLNQAIAAARAGAQTAMCGAVGADQRGRDLLAVLAVDHVDTQGVQVLADRPTGLAVILLRSDGENSIVIDPAANAAMPRIARESMQGASVVLASLEIPLDPVAAAFREARSAGKMRILNAAPAVEGGEKLFELADHIIVNETELAHYAGPFTTEEERIFAARSLVSQAKQTVIITLGGAGVQIVDKIESVLYPAIPAQVVDTTGAGDCFSGVFAAGLARGLPLEAAVIRAIAAASLAVRKPGAAAAMPSGAAIDALVEEQRLTLVKRFI